MIRASTERLRKEMVFHDLQARQRAGRFRDEPALRFSDDTYLDHETWIRPAFARLGEVSGCHAARSSRRAAPPGASLVSLIPTE